MLLGQEGGNKKLGILSPKQSFMNLGKIFFWSITVALGGFLFGFDTAVISGAEQAIQSLWGLSDAMIGQMVAMALYGTVIGALLGGIPADKFGRKTTLFWMPRSCCRHDKMPSQQKM